MTKYECAVVLVPTLGSDELRGTTEKYSNLITSQGGSLTKIDEWGKRSLAYEIEDHREGFYYFYRFEGTTEIITELNRQLRIDENVLRHMIVRDDDHRAAYASDGTEESAASDTPETGGA